MDKLRFYLQWWAEYKLPESVPRDYDLDAILNSRLIPVLVGPRRCGKSTLFFQLINKLQLTVPKKNLLYINFEDDRLLPLNGSELSDILNIHRQKQSHTTSDLLYLFLDEIQNLPNWEKSVRRIYETEENVRLFITGSNAQMFAANIASNLRGRALTFNIFPLHFLEFLKFNERDIETGSVNDIRYSRKLNPLLYDFNRYLIYGGFPEVTLENREDLKEKILKEYLHTIFFADLIERYEIRNIKLMDTFLKILARQMSSLFSANKLTNALNSIGFNTTKNTV